MATAAVAVTVASAGPSTAYAGSSFGDLAWAQPGANAALSRDNTTETLLGAGFPFVEHRRDITAAASTTCENPIESPVITYGYIYAVVNGWLTKYVASSGAVLWRTDLSGYTGGTPAHFQVAVGSGLVIVSARQCDPAVSAPSGAVAAYTSQTGALSWADTTDAWATVSVSAGYVVTSSPKSTTYTFNSVFVRKIATGKVTWGMRLTACGRDQVAVVGGNVIYTDCGYQGLHPKLAAVPIGSAFAAQPIWTRAGSWNVIRGDNDVTGQNVFAALYTNGSLSAIKDLNPATGATRYALPASSSDVLAVDASSVYTRCNVSAVCSLDRATGATRWHTAAGTLDPHSVVAEATNGLFLDTGQALDTAAGRVYATYGSSSTPDVVVGNGRLLLLNGTVLSIWGPQGF